ncbi:homer protein homolog 2-like isoform X2 [Hetaerina americana]|uniref:homer protein homolog 2-like isoform X2 n=1 Tax=Hetaerina americana TaxID=62018 RepID=UPI003A7F42CA
MSKMSIDPNTVASNHQTKIEANTVMESGKAEEQEITEQSDLIKKLQDQLSLATAENETQKRMIESHLLQFQNERDSWISGEKESLNITSPPDASTKGAPQQKDEYQQLESALKICQEELKNAREELQKAQERINSLESLSKGSTNTGRDQKHTKHPSDKNPPQPSNSAAEEGLRKENEKLRTALTTAVARLKDKTMQATSMEQQNVQLRAQVVSLKEVTGITKDLLGIRNSEVEHLRGEMEAVEAKIQAEKTQRAQAIERVERATHLNASLKREYEFQLSTFKKLRSKYEEKMELLASENRRLVAEANAEGRPGVALDIGPIVTDDEEMPQH